MSDAADEVSWINIHAATHSLALKRQPPRQPRAVAESAQGQGVGRKLVEACWASAAELEIKSVFTLTYVANFFERCGFHQIEKTELPHKIWNECVRCPLFPSCNEVALVRSVAAATEETAAAARGALAESVV